MRWLSWALCCCLLIIAALLRKRGGTLRELRLAQPARTPTKFLVLMMKGRVGADRWRRLQLRRRPVPHAVKYGFRTPSAEGRVSTRGSQFYGA